MDSRNANDGNPSIPLPNPGEGGAVYPGMTEDNMQNNSATPVIPLPNPGEGGAAFPGTGRPQGGNAGNIGGTVLPNIIGTIISTYPRPNEPCRFCSPTNPRAGYARFLNAATGYNPFVVTKKLEEVTVNPSNTHFSFENGLLEHDLYTKPSVFKGLEVPTELRSGDHGKIADFRLKQSILRTRAHRNDLWNKFIADELNKV